jgi:hypothetical protein
MHPRRAPCEQKELLSKKQEWAAAMGLRASRYHDGDNSPPISCRTGPGGPLRALLSHKPAYVASYGMTQNDEAGRMDDVHRPLAEDGKWQATSLPRP